MIRRLIGPVLGIAGLVAVAVGGVALLLRPAPIAYPKGDLGTVVAVIPPSVIALEGLEAITITAPGSVDIRTARPSDAYAWAVEVETSVVRGLDSWEGIQVDRAGSMDGAVPEFPGDLWRDWDFGYQVMTIEASDIEPGLAVVVVSGSGEPLGEVTFEVTHDRGSGWAWPVLAGGLGALAVGLAIIVADLVLAGLGRRRARKGEGA